MAVQNDKDAGLKLPGFVELPIDLDDHFIGSRDSKHTRQVVATSVNVLSDYCNKSSGTTLADVEQMTPGELCQFLRSFYSTVRQKDGSFYARSSMMTLRYGLQRHFQKLLHLDIANDAIFKPANTVFNTILTNLKSSVKISLVQRKNMAKIRSSPATDCSTPRGLQNTVFLDMMLHLCSSSYGRSNLRGMKKSHFVILSDPLGRRFVCFAVKQTTGRRAEHEIESDESDDDLTATYSANISRMYETPEKPESCPVRCFEKYMSRLNPACTAFWQRPKLPNKIFYSPYAECWYDGVPLGKNALGNKMREISAEAGCSIMYTNQCLKATGKLMNHIGHAGCRARCGDYCYSEAMTSDNDSSASENDGQMDDGSSPQQNAHQENDGHIIAVENGATGQDQSGFHIKLEDSEMLAGNQLVTNPCVGTAQAGMQHVVNAPPITSSAGYPIENPSHLYPVNVNNVSSNHNNSSTHQGPAASQQSPQIPNGIDLDAWAVEISWVDERNQRKWLLTKKTTTSSAVEDAWRRSVELQTQRNAMLTDHSHQDLTQQDCSANLPKQDLQTQRNAMLTDHSHQDHTQQGSFANLPNHDLQTQRNALLTDHSYQDHTQLGASANLPSKDLGNPFPCLSRSASEMPPHPRLPSNGPSSSGAGAAQSVGSVTGGSSGIATKSTVDDQLIQLQKNVLMMQQENLALERQKIRLEMAKLEAEKLKLDAERRKLTMEGDKLQRELL
ncbi:uncharacterized protein LOC119745501 [Patiria miniata]|uniref:DUF3504 domain-containing protein n=1 Tax=Patiria miniata TaxID=46514 RepID=A0A914BNU3_PATMI|nr:uncharacterized protein LOC119745501 [Patiria miniata]